MKITQPTCFNFPVKSPQIVNWRRCNNETDVFVSSRSCQSPSFKAAPQNIYKKILENPTLSQKFMGLVSAAAASLIACAHLDNEEEINEPIDFRNVFHGVVGTDNEYKQEKLEQELEEYKEENSKLKQKLEDLEAQINLLNSATKAKGVNLEKAPVIADENDVCIKFEFPKKWGKLSELQKKLKEAANNLMLTEIAYEQLTFISQKALQKGVIDNNLLALFCEDLAFAEDKEPVIKTFYDKLVNLDAETRNFTAPEISSEFKDDFLEDDILAKAGVKIVGKIDPTKLKTKEKNEASLIPIITDEKSDSTFIFKTYLSRSQDMAANISKLISRFQKKIYSDYKLKEKAGLLTEFETKSPKWKYNQKIPEHVLAEDIVKEIEKVTAAQKTFGSCKYTNISEITPEEVASIINSDERFRELFTLHGALRFIDRYLDFDSDVDFEIQGMKLLDELYKVIQKSVNDGVLIDSYVVEGYYAPRMNISSENFDESAKEIFGNSDLHLTFTEAQATFRYIPTHNKQGLICTIYSK